MNKRYYSGEPFLWKEEYLEQLKGMAAEFENDDSGHSRLHFFLSRDDEVLSFDTIPVIFRNAGSINYFEDCGHSFTRFEEIIPTILELTAC